MATTKVLKPTNETITIPAMSETPDATNILDALDKEGDAINALDDHLANIRENFWFAKSTITRTLTAGDIVLLHNGGRNYCFVIENNNYSILFNNNYSSGLTITVSGTTVTIVNDWYDLYCTIYKL